jgi:oxalate---CoA ligase
MAESARMSMIQAVIQEQAQRFPEGLALTAPTGLPLPYHRLDILLRSTLSRFKELGIGPHCRVAVVMPRGPEAIVSSLATMAGAVCLPLNPDFHEHEFRARLVRLMAHCVLTWTEAPPMLLSAARALGLPVVRAVLHPGGEAGEIRIADMDPVVLPEPCAGSAIAVGVVMLTSGTTGEPKRVPLTESNLCASAADIRRWMDLGPGDRFLCVAPPYHIVGITLVLASVSAGSCTFCAPGLDATRFFAWMEQFRPTWFWAAPSILRELLPLARQHRHIVDSCPLRFIRVGAASLSPEVLREAEEIFRAPVIENYGMTEAAPQITCNPLPPGKRKPGSAGLPAGPEVRIVSERGEPATAGVIGEIVVRGTNITSGYENDPEGNATAFRNGWLHTGDVGYCDPEGYLFVTGRQKEMINRGGESIFPREVEEVLLRHPAIADAVVFGMPHPRLQEDVAAAIVPREGTSVTDTEIRAYARASLMDAKVPSRIVIVSQIPRTAAGKVSRVGMVERLGMTPEIGHPVATVTAQPGTPLEEKLGDIWRQILGVERIGLDDDFFEHGGGSLLFAVLCQRIEQEFGPKASHLAASEFRALPTVRTLARVVEKLAPDLADFGGGLPAGAPPRVELSTRAASVSAPTLGSRLVALQPEGARLPFFFMPGSGEHPSFYRNLSVRLGTDQPFHVLCGSAPVEARGVYSVHETAMSFLNVIRQVSPNGPYLLGGHCFGGIVAFEMARLLAAEGAQVALLVLVDAPMPGYPSPVRHLHLCLMRAWFRVRTLPSRTIPDAARYVFGRCRALVRLVSLHVRDSSQRVLFRTGATAFFRPAQRISDANTRAIHLYVPAPYPGRAVQLCAAADIETGSVLDKRLGWREVVRGGFDVQYLPGDHHSMFAEPHVETLAAVLRSRLDGVNAGASERPPYQRDAGSPQPSVEPH